MKNRRRFLTIAFILVAIGVLLCMFIPEVPYILYQSRKENFPLYQDGTCWVCEEPYIVLYMDSSYDGLNYGFIYTESETLEVTLLTNYKSAVLAQKDDRVSPGCYYDLIWGACRYTDSTIVIQVEGDALFGGRYERLILKKAA